MKSSIAKRCALIGVATVAAGLAVNQASAAPSDSEPTQVVVRYSDLDLSQPHDARTLYTRIRIAAREACGDVYRDDLARIVKFDACMEQAVTAAVAKVSSPQVSEIHQAQTQRLSRS
jgi:UrcA family protein